MSKPSIAPVAPVPYARATVTPLPDGTFSVVYTYTSGSRGSKVVTADKLFRATAGYALVTGD